MKAANQRGDVSHAVGAAPGCRARGSAGAAEFVVLRLAERGEVRGAEPSCSGHVLQWCRSPLEGATVAPPTGLPRPAGAEGIIEFRFLAGRTACGGGGRPFFRALAKGTCQYCTTAEREISLSREQNRRANIQLRFCKSAGLFLLMH